MTHLSKVHFGGLASVKVIEGTHENIWRNSGFNEVLMVVLTVWMNIITLASQTPHSLARVQVHGVILYVDCLPGSIM